MLRVIQILFAPSSTWLRIAEVDRGVLFVLFVSLLPLLAVSLGIEGWALMQWGERRGEFGSTMAVSFALAWRHGLTQAGLFIASTLLAAFSLFSIARSFNLQAPFRAAFATVAYGLGPIILMHPLDGFPQLPTWLCWAVGAFLSAASLYHGIALVMKPEQTKGFGLYMVAVLTVWTSTAVSHFVGIAVLHGRLWRG